MDDCQLLVLVTVNPHDTIDPLGINQMECCHDTELPEDRLAKYAQIQILFFHQFDWTYGGTNILYVNPHIHSI